MSRKGFTLTEALMAGSLSLLLLMAAEATMRHIGQISGRARHELGARQQARAFLTHARGSLMSASHLFLGWSGTLVGLPIDVPLAGRSGSSLLYAVPADDSTDPAYEVVLLTPQTRSEGDPNNPDALGICMHRFLPTRSVPACTPGALQPLALRPGSNRFFDCYLSPETRPALRFTVSPNGEGVEIALSLRVQPPRGAIYRESFTTFVAMRNHG